MASLFGGCPAMPWVFERISQPQTFDEIYVYIDTFTYSKVWYGMVWIKEKQTKSPEGECCVLVLLSRLQLLLPIYKSIKKKKKNRTHWDLVSLRPGDMDLKTWNWVPSGTTFVREPGHYLIYVCQYLSLIIGYCGYSLWWRIRKVSAWAL